MNVLVIGGTIFLGRRIVEAAVARGHAVSVFSRGQHNPDVHSGVEKIRGDRNRDVTVLRGRSWDAVIDTCGYVPLGVQLVAEAVAHSTLHYTFISSISVYADMPADGIDESGPVSTMPPGKVSEAEEMAVGARATGATYGEWYGALKVLCESAAETAMPGRVLNVRPGLIVGPYDYTDRFTYWVRRVDLGGRVLCPGRASRRVRVIDARDLAEWIVVMMEQRRTGTYNASGAEDGLTFGRMLDTCRRVGNENVELHWTDEAYLLAQNVAPWSELPLWIPESENGIFEVRNDRAIAAGLTFRPLDATVRDTLEWDRANGIDRPLRSGLSRDREEQLLRDAPHSSH